MNRNPKADLEMCERATPGPWSAEETNALSIVAGKVEYTNGKMTCGGFIADIDEDNNENAEADARLLAESREALPYWIKRAMEAEGMLVKCSDLVACYCARECNAPPAECEECDYNKIKAKINEVVYSNGTEPCDK